MRREIILAATLLTIVAVIPQVRAQGPPQGNSLAGRVTTLEEKVSGLESSTQNLQQAVSSLQNTTQSLQQSVSGLQNTTQSIQQNVANLQNTSQSLQQSVSGLEQATQSLQQALNGVQHVCTKITALPYVINSPGKYCLGSNLSTAITTGSAIQINADLVVLDLNGFGLTGAPAGPGSHANGIYCMNRKSVTIRNGTVSNFYNGISLEGSASAWSTIESVRVQNVTYQAIRVEGQGHIVRNNQVVGTTGNPDAASGGNGTSVGIGAYGSRNIIINNDVINTAAVGNGIGTGINLNASDHSVVENNRVVSTTGPVNPFAIFIGSSTNVLVVNNRIITAHVGIHYSNSTGLYRDNLVTDSATRYLGGTDAGNNQ